MLAILIPVISAIVPLLVRKAEDAFEAPKSGADKHAWVLAAVKEAVDVLMKHLGNPVWAESIETPIETVIADAIEAALDKMEADSVAK